LSAPCVADHAPKLTINGTAFTDFTVRIVGYSEAKVSWRNIAITPTEQRRRFPQSS
jgi:hypothetical protein